MEMRDVGIPTKVHHDRYLLNARFKKVVIVVTAGAFLLTVGVGFWFMRSLSGFLGETIVHRETADSFYQKEVKGYVVLPKEAKIEQIEHTTRFVDNTYLLTVRLPGTVSPSLWVTKLWESNGYAEGAQVGPKEYRAYHADKPGVGPNWKFSKDHHGYRRIYFDGDSDRFVVEIDTD
jgi:hypothetical protein